MECVESKACQDDDSRTISAAAILENVGSELRGLASAVEELEDLTAELATGICSASLCRLQNLDSIRQSLEGIADFLESLAEDLTDTFVDPASPARIVKLAELGRRLGFALREDECDEAGATGELELFGQVA